MKNNPKRSKAHGATPKTKSQTKSTKKTNENALTEAEKEVRKELRSGGTHSIPQHKARLATELEELRERFLFSIEMWAADKYRYEWLENHTGIPAARWQNVLLEKQFPTVEMLIVVCHANPAATYWLMRGIPQPLKYGDPGFSLAGWASPSEETFNAFKAHRKWINEKRKSKAKTK